MSANELETARLFAYSGLGAFTFLVAAFGPWLLYARVLRIFRSR